MKNLGLLVLFASFAMLSSGCAITFGGRTITNTETSHSGSAMVWRAGEWVPVETTTTTTTTTTTSAPPPANRQVVTHQVVTTSPAATRQQSVTYHEPGFLDLLGAGVDIWNASSNARAARALSRMSHRD